MAVADTDRFIEALRRLEEDRDVEPLAALHAPDADISNPLVQHVHRGPDGARRFWRGYRGSFETVRSEFHHAITDGRSALLEWTSAGTLADGKPFRYRGVTVLEFGADGIAAFRSYFDPRVLAEKVDDDPVPHGHS